MIGRHFLFFCIDNHISSVCWIKKTDDFLTESALIIKNLISMSQSVGLEPTLPEGIWFLVRRLNHSAKTAWCLTYEQLENDIIWNVRKLKLLSTFFIQCVFICCLCQLLIEFLWAIKIRTILNISTYMLWKTCWNIQVSNK